MIHMKIKKLSVSREHMTRRLTAYSAMAGAALAFMPATNAAIVYPSDGGLDNICPPASISEMPLQGQIVQSQKVRHRHLRKRVESNTTNCPNNTGAGSSYTTTTYTTQPVE
jgi:hypothetical protein